MKTKPIQYSGAAYISAKDFTIKDIPKKLHNTFLGELTNSRINCFKDSADSHVYNYESLIKFKKKFIKKWINHGLITVGQFSAKNKFSNQYIHRFNAILLRSWIGCEKLHKKHKDGVNLRSRPLVLYNEDDLVTIRTTMVTEAKKHMLITLVQFTDIYPVLQGMDKLKEHLGVVGVDGEHGFDVSKSMLYTEDYLIKEYKESLIRKK